MHITQPSVSRNIAQLEEEIGVPLFDRLPHEVRMTPAGRKFLPYAERTLAELERGIHALARQSLDIRLIRIATIHSWSIQRALTHDLQTIQRLLPQTKFKILTGSTAEVHQMLTDGHADMGICCGPCDTEEMTSKILFQQELALFIPKTFRERVHEPYDLKDVPWIQYHRQIGHYRTVEGLWQQYGIEPSVVAEGASSNLVANMVIEGLGCGLLPVTAPSDLMVNLSRADLSDLVPRQIHNVFLVHRRTGEDAVLRQVVGVLSSEELA